jgi:hypothetical protein
MSIVLRLVSNPLERNCRAQNRRPLDSAVCEPPTHGDQRSRETASEVGNVLPVGEHRLPHHDKLVVAAPGCDESKTLSGREL